MRRMALVEWCLGIGDGANPDAGAASLDPAQPRRLPRVSSFVCGVRLEENSMMDLIVIGLGLGFFAAAVGYTYACERL